MAEPTHRNRILEHIRLKGFAQPKRYQPPSRDFSDLPVPTRPADVHEHGYRLAYELRATVEKTRKKALESDVGAVRAPGGTYVSVNGRDDFVLEVKKLESAGMLVVAHPSSPEFPAEDRVEDVGSTAAQDVVTVFIPEGKLHGVLKRLNEYANTPDKPKNEALVNRLGGFRRATLRSLWTDAAMRFPVSGERLWWEVWLRADGAGTTLERFRLTATRLQIDLGQRTLVFADRIVVLAQATPEQFELVMLECGDLAELRRAKSHPRVFSEMNNQEQGDWARELAERVDIAGPGAPAVCILDGGVNRAHSLIEPALSVQDTNSVNPAWGTADHRSDGHGTAMAGMALFGSDLPAYIEGSHRVQLRHRLESVKILPLSGANPPDLYGAVTRDAVNVAEAHAPQRSVRTFSMAVTADENDLPGEPTSWSAAIDALAAGRVIDPIGPGLRYDLGANGAPRRLIMVSAGNVDSTDVRHVQKSQASPVEDPAQAWNALTVGAYTAKTSADIQNPKLAGATVVARPGDLSPYSTTSVDDGFAGWPIKPEILMEGGNKYVMPGTNTAWQHDDLLLLTTNANTPQAHFTVTGMTSAAVSQAARMAATVQAVHADLWPETVRALLVHSARWTPQMECHLSKKANRTETEKFARTFGFGVPDLDRALRSARDALTLICEDELSPYNIKSYGYMNYYELPWPIRELRNLGSEKVELRVTLSYFVDPYPVRKEGEKQARYPSTHLRFELKQALETSGNFLKRINEKENNKDRTRAPKEQGDWFLGPIARHVGSLHHDVWTGTASELADKGVLAVTPVAGWMKDAPRQRLGRDRLRYALVVSIETTAVDADLWAEVDQRIRLSGQVDVSTPR